MEQTIIDKMKSGIGTILDMKDFGEMVATFWNNKEKEKYFSRAYKEVMILYKNKYGIDFIYSTNAPMEDERGKEWNSYIDRMKKKLKENENSIDLLEKMKDCWRTSERDNEEQLGFLTKTFLEKIIQYGCVDGKEVIIREIFRKQGEIKYIQTQLLKNQQQGQVNSETILEITIDTNQKVTELLKNQTSTSQEKDKLKGMFNKIAEKRQEYVARYEEELPPMDDDSVSVNLKQLYVEPDCLPVYPYKSKNKCLLFPYLKEFLCSNTRLLFMEGDAGIGKTSFVSKIAYHYEHFEENKLGDNFFQDRQLICVRLRDMLEKNQILNIDNPWEDIFRYLNVNKDEQKAEENQLSLLILDGFDELCMVESIQNEKKTQYFKNLLKNLKFGRIRWKVIVTSRPNYIHWEELEDFSSYIKVIQLQHFSIEKRRKWIEKAKRAELNISEEVEKGISTIDREELEAIIGIPWTLYLIAKKEIVITSDANLWHIYYLIFKRENIERNFEMDAAHKTEPLKEYLYQITEEIAFWMYQNQKFDINVDKINQLIEKMEIPNEAKKNKQNEKTIPDGGEQRIYRLLKDTYALHTYYRKINDKGGLAFYHNYIQDFFLCEYIFGELNRTYIQLEGLKEFSARVSCLIKCCTNLFLSGLLNENTIHFIEARIKYECETESFRDSKWIEFEKKNGIIIQVFEDIILYGLRNLTVNKPILEAMKNILCNIWSIYDYLYQMDKEENQVLINIFKQDQLTEMKKLVLRDILLYANIQKKHLRYINLNGVNLKNAVLIKKDLTEVNLSRADLREINLSRTILVDAKLTGADLREAYLSNTKLIGADLCGAMLQGAYLGDIDLQGADLTGSNMTGVYLSGDLRRAKLVRADLSNTVLIGVDLSEADLKGTDLTNAKLRDINLTDANLEGVRLIQFDLNNIDVVKMLSKANLNNADWNGVTIEQKANLLNGFCPRRNKSHKK